MVDTDYIPDRGDLLWLNFSPQSGHEQKGRRPAIVLSPKNYNKKTGLAIFCPVTSKVKNYPFEVQFSSKVVSGAILSDQVKNLDWRYRDIEYIEHTDEDVLAQVLENIHLLLYTVA